MNTGTYARAIGYLGGRKFIAFLMVLLSVHLLAWKNMAVFGSIYQTVVVAAIAAYIAGNVTQKAVEKKKTEESKTAD